MDYATTSLFEITSHGSLVGLLSGSTSDDALDFYAKGLGYDDFPSMQTLNKHLADGATAILVEVTADGLKYVDHNDVTHKAALPSTMEATCESYARRRGYKNWATMLFRDLELRA